MIKESVAVNKLQWRIKIKLEKEKRSPKWSGSHAGTQDEYAVHRVSVVSGPVPLGLSS